MNNYYQERILELQNDAIKIKMRHSDKVFVLCLELSKDLEDINRKIEDIRAKASKEETKSK